MTKSANKIISIAIKDMKHIQNVLNRLLQISAKIKNIPFSKMVKILIYSIICICLYFNRHWRSLWRSSKTK